MKQAYIINAKESRYYPICKELERRGYNVNNLIFYEDYPTPYPIRLNIIFLQKILSAKELEYIDANEGQQFASKRIEKYFSNISDISINNVSFAKDDLILCLNEFHLFESSFINNRFLSQNKALALISKHIYYRKLNIPFKKIYTREDYINLNEDSFFLKPSICSFGKRGCFKITNDKEKKELLIKNPEIFNGKRLFIAMPIVQFKTEIWVFTLFDSNGKPYLLWFLTENGNSTFSPFEKDLYIKIKKINDKLQIKSWMVTIQFLLDENGDLHFIDLNPRLPGDDDWYELVYKYLTGTRLSKTILDLILHDKKPIIYRTNKYVVEKENDKLDDKNIFKIWPYTDLYKKNPVLYFKKYKE